MRRHYSLPRHVISIGGFAARHFVAMFVVVAGACILWTVAYFALLLWAVLSGGGVGGPLAFPVGLLLVLVASALAVVVLLMPSAALAERMARWLQLPILAQIPLSVGFLAALCLSAGVVARLLEHPHFAAGNFVWTGGLHLSASPRAARYLLVGSAEWAIAAVSASQAFTRRSSSKHLTRRCS